MSRTGRNAKLDRLTDLLAVAGKALRQGHLSLAEHLLQLALGIDPDSTHAHALLGALHESVGEIHAAYQCYRTALLKDRYYGPALDGMRRCCDRTGLDSRTRESTPALELAPGPGHGRRRPHPRVTPTQWRRRHESIAIDPDCRGRAQRSARLPYCALNPRTTPSAASRIARRPSGG